jgi:hypothetical protein
MTKNYTWKAWLRLNLLTKDVKNDYFADVSTTGKVIRNEEIAKAMTDQQGSELQYETLLDILNRADRLRRLRLQEGYSVHTGVCHFAPRITGTWLGTAHAFDPRQHHITIDAIPNADLRAALEEVGVEILGVKADGGAEIALATDTATGKTDGAVSPYGTLTIDGEKIKIAPLAKEGADAEGLGVFFVSADGTKTAAIFGLSLNDPKKVICTVPALAPGEYTLQIVTRFSSSSQLLKEPRTITYGLPLTVAANAKQEE